MPVVKGLRCGSTRENNRGPLWGEKITLRVDTVFYPDGEPEFPMREFKSRYRFLGQEGSDGVQVDYYTMSGERRDAAAEYSEVRDEPQVEIEPAGGDPRPFAAPESPAEAAEPRPALEEADLDPDEFYRPGHVIGPGGEFDPGNCAQGTSWMVIG